MSAFPERLYHYTGQSAFLSIIKTRVLWASKIQYLNDTTEFQHGLDAIISSVSALEQGDLDTLLKTYLKEVRERVARLSAINVFVLSFSATSDLLSQWRAYSNDEIGYALGFEANRLADLASDQGFTLVPCIYERELQSRKAEEFVKHQTEYFCTQRFRFETSDEQIKAEWMSNLVGEFCQNVSILAPQFKDRAFSEEREWRLISVPKSLREPAYGVRCGKRFLIPYYTFRLEQGGELIVNEVIIGPSVDMDLARDAASSLLSSQGEARWAVSNSRIPYRQP